MTSTDAMTEIVDMTMMQRKYLVMIGTAAELGGKISDINKLNMITDRRMVISRHVGGCRRCMGSSGTLTQRQLFTAVGCENESEDGHATDQETGH